MTDTISRNLFFLAQACKALSLAVVMTVVFRALKVKSIISNGTCILPESSSVSIVRAVFHAVEEAMMVAAFSSSFLDTLSRSTLCCYVISQLQK